MKVSVLKNIQLSKDLPTRFPGAENASLHPELTRRLLKVSSVGFNLHRSRWQVPFVVQSLAMLLVSANVQLTHHCPFLLGPGAHNVLFVLSKCLSPSPVYVLVALWWANGDLLPDGLCLTQVCCTQSPCPCGSPLLTCASPGDTQTQSVSASLRPLVPGVHKVCLSPLSVSGGYGQSI